MSRITLLQCLMVDLDIAIARYPGCHYWDETLPTLCDQPVTPETVLNAIASMQGTYIINGLIPASGIDRKLQLFLVNLSRSPNAALHVVLVTPPIEVSSDLYPFVTFEKIDLPNSDHLRDLLRAFECFNDEVFKAALGLSEGELRRLLPTITEDVSSALQKYKQGKLMAMGLSLIPDPDVALAGLDNLNQLLDNAARLLNSDATQYGLSFPKGVLMWGVPGSGKTLAAKHAASRMKLPMLSLNWNTLLSPVLGQSEGNLRQILEVAEALSPCLLYADDFDKAFTGSNLDGVSSVEKRITGILLTWLQDNPKPIYFMASVNRAEQMPPELLRRFEDIVFFDYPHCGQAQSVFSLHLSRYTASFHASKLEWQQILMEYNMTTPAEIARAVKKCAERSYFEGRPGQITAQDLVFQRSQFVSGYKRDEASILKIMKNAALAMPATSDDDSEFRIENSEMFANYLGDL